MNAGKHVEYVMSPFRAADADNRRDAAALVKEGIFTMNKNELSAAIAAKAGLTRKDAEAALCAMSEIIAESLKNGEKVQIVGFGAFEVKERPARKARNPKTGEEIQIGARRSPMFKPGKTLKEAVEG